MREAIVIPFNDAPDFSQLSNEDENMSNGYMILF